MDRCTGGVADRTEGRHATSSCFADGEHEMKAIFGGLLVVAGFVGLIAAAIYVLGAMGLVDSQLVQNIVMQAVHRLF